MKSLESERMELFPYPGKHPVTKLGHLPALSQQMSYSSSITASTELFILPEKLLSRLDRKKYSPKRIFIGCANLKYSDDLEMKTWKFENYDSCADTKRKKLYSAYHLRFHNKNKCANDFDICHNRDKQPDF